jgi:D-alanyl-D-alanine carboxypeptidase/D-alanyl-D-alanine-endopeptidase (penicillin-binding protein 4)
VPQSGDGDLWPTTDDDTSSPGAKDAETHELPVPDQQKQPEKPSESTAGAAEAPEGAPKTGASAATDDRRDEPHAKPGQQITQPVSWPVADLERQAAAEDPVRSFSRPLPTTGNEKTAIVKRPAWPTTNGGNQPPTPEGRQETPPPSDSDRREAAGTGAARDEPQGDSGKREPASAAQSGDGGREADSDRQEAAGATAARSGDDGRGADPDRREAAEAGAARPDPGDEPRSDSSRREAPSGDREAGSDPREAAVAPSGDREARSDQREAAAADAARPDRDDGSQSSARWQEAGGASAARSDRDDGSQPSARWQEALGTSAARSDRDDGSQPSARWQEALGTSAARSDRDDDSQPSPRRQEAAGASAARSDRDDDSQPSARWQEAAGASAARPDHDDSQPDPARREAAGASESGRREAANATPPGDSDRVDAAQPQRQTAASPGRTDESERDSGRQDSQPQRQAASPGQGDESQRDSNRRRLAEPQPGAGANLAWPEGRRDGAQPDAPRREGRPGSAGDPRRDTPQARPGNRVDDPRAGRREGIGRPGEGPRPGTRGEDAPTSFVRPVSAPRQEGAPPSFLRPDKEAGFVRRQEPPSFARPDNATTTFIRRDKSFSDSATVNLSRQESDRGEWPPPEPPRAAPQRVGPQPEPAEPEPGPEQKKTRKPLLIAAISIAAVIAIAAGVVFGVPGLSDKLGLTGEDPVAIAPPPAPITYSPALHGPDAATAGPTRQGVELALSGPMANPALGNVNGIVIDPATGETLYEKNADGAITPASTGKLLTAAAALLSLDPTEQLVTKVVEGDQPGEVIIVGGGDPTISSLEVGKESIYPGAAHLSELVDQVKASGAQVQTVYIDQSRYAAPGLAPSWLPADIGAGYIAPIVPAMLDGDRQTDPAENYSARTTDPGRTLVDEFANRIGASPADSIEKKAPENAKVLGEIKSAPVTQLVDNMLNRSENTLADVLAHEVAIKAGEEPNFDGASKAMLDVLRQNGFDVEGVVLRDGSGMSEENKMTARLLAEVLAVAASPDGKDPRTAKLRPLLGGLPVAGGSGTLAERYTEADSLAGKGWVRAKTGSLTGINSLAGIVLDKDNRPLVFAFLTSGTVSTSARPALDSVSATLRGCGCQ